MGDRNSVMTLSELGIVANIKNHAIDLAETAGAKLTGYATDKVKALAVVLTTKAVGGLNAADEKLNAFLDSKRPAPTVVAILLI